MSVVGWRYQSRSSRARGLPVRRACVRRLEAPHHATDDVDDVNRRRSSAAAAGRRQLSRPAVPSPPGHQHALAYLGRGRENGGLAAWRSGSVVRRMNEVTVRRARLVLGWVTLCGWVTVSAIEPPPTNYHQRQPTRKCGSSRKTR